MGTRCLVRFYRLSKDQKTLLVTIYRLFDGAPWSAGLMLGAFLRSKKLVNGVSGNGLSVANRSGCLAAQYIALAKAEAGALDVQIRADGPVEPEMDFVYDVIVREEWVKSDRLSSGGSDLQFSLSVEMPLHYQTFDTVDRFIKFCQCYSAAEGEVEEWEERRQCYSCRPLDEVRKQTSAIARRMADARLHA